jgi:hypothetical protein
MRTLTLNQIGYLVTGTTTLNLWGGGQGEITMSPTELKELTTANVLESINDNGFGCESYAGACVDVYRLYENGVTRHLVSVDFDSEDLVGCTRYGCDFNKLASEYEKKHETITDEGEE